MKLTILSFLTLVACNVFSQDLPTNPQTGFVSISDSLQLKDKSLQEVKDALSKWGYSLNDKANIEKIFKLGNSKQVEFMAFNLIIAYPLTIEKGNNQFLNNGTFTYTKAKEVRLFNAVSSSPANGVIKFSLYYTVTPKKLLYEFTNFEFSNTGNYFGKFEDEKPPKENMGIMSLNKKMWQDIKLEHFNRIKILSVNFKEFINTLLQTSLKSTNSSPINYESYKQIKTGMAYDDLVKLLGDEGKELSNSSSPVNGKMVTQQTIIWSDLDKSKNITIIFTDGKVVSKTQSNL